MRPRPLAAARRPALDRGASARADVWVIEVMTRPRGWRQLRPIAASRLLRRRHRHLCRLTGQEQNGSSSHGEWGVRMLPIVNLAYPSEGRWLTQNSPADRVPSHGTTLIATAFAIVFVPVNEAWVELTGEHVMVETRGGPVVAVCLLQRGSVQVRLGQSVRVGETLGRCGNSGNTTEPHVHLQVMDCLNVLHAFAVPITFGGHLPRNGEIIDPG